MDIRVFEAPEGERLDVAIAAALEFSRTRAKELVSEGYVQLDGRPVGKPSLKLSGREIVSVLVPPPRPMLVEAEDIPLDILYEDEDMAVINKPPGLTAHPTASLRTGTVVNALLGRIELSKERRSDPHEDDYRPGIVHRLDKDTSGIMVVAKNDLAHRHLANSFKKRLTEKEYVALASGDMPSEVLVDAPIGRHPHERQKMTVGGVNPRKASTYFWVLGRAPSQNGPPNVLVRAKPHTGRTHQIRVHLAHLGAGIIGDKVYGRGSAAIARQALHAFRLTLPHPRDNTPIAFEAEPPLDMVEAWLELGGSWPAFGKG